MNVLGVKYNSELISRPLNDNVFHRVNTTYLTKRPSLVGILASNDESSHKYAEYTRKICEKNGIIFNLHETTKSNIESYIKYANNASDIDGIIIYYPIFGDQEHIGGGKMDDYLKEQVNYKKDVEGLSHFYRYNLYHGIKSNVYFTPLHNIGPCTALAVIKCLEYFNYYKNFNLPNNKLFGKTITVLNRSNIVGKPISLLLANDGADVYSVDKDSIFLMRKEVTGKIYNTEKSAEEACQQSDIIILGVPDPTYKLDTKHIRENTFVINVSSYKNVDEDELLKIKGVKYINSIGKITLAMLQYNLLSLCDQFRGGNITHNQNI